MVYYLYARDGVRECFLCVFCAREKEKERERFLLTVVSPSRSQSVRVLAARRQIVISDAHSVTLVAPSSIHPHVTAITSCKICLQYRYSLPSPHIPNIYIYLKHTPRAFHLQYYYYFILLRLRALCVCIIIIYRYILGNWYIIYALYTVFFPLVISLHHKSSQLKTVVLSKYNFIGYVFEVTRRVSINYKI